MYADDQYVHRQSLRLTTITELELDNNFTTYTNGKQVLEMIDSILSHLEQTTYTQESFEIPIQPVLLCILDINMPILDGL